MGYLKRNWAPCECPRAERVPEIVNPKTGFEGTYETLANLRDHALGSSAPEHKKQAVKKLEEFNVEQVFALYETREGVPTKVPVVANQQPTQVC